MPTAYARTKGKSIRRDGDSTRPIAAGLNLDPRHVNVIDKSHQRCAAFGLSRIEQPDLGLIGRSDLAVARDRNLRLHAHAAPVMELLYDQIVNTQSMVVLTDATGTILHAIGDDDFLDRASKVALLPGAVWSEQHKGTNAVGTALMEEVPTLVHADEHYFHANQFLTCSAAPILDPRGNILGVLDVSGDHRSYHQHTMALVKMSARMIENHWLTDDYRSVMRLHFHSRVEFIGTLMEGIIAVKPDGRIVGANRGALEQLAMSGATLRMQTLESLFGTSVGALVDRFRTPLATPLAVHGSVGRPLFLHARFDWPVWTSLAEAVAAQVPSTATDSAAARLAAVHAMSDDDGPATGSPNAAGLPAAASDPQVSLVAEHVRRGLERGIPIVVQGETGTGKEWLARTAHDAARAAQVFHVVACAGVSPAEFESSFRFAPMGGLGGATLFLDEVDDLPVPTQALLLKLLDQHEHVAGAARIAAVPAAIVCASRANLRALVDARRFREDLYYRLNGLTVRLPPLRERGDLESLAASLLERESPGSAPQLDAEVLQLLQRHHWPGNVRQLFNLLRATMLLSGGDALITRRSLPKDFVEEALTEPGRPSTTVDAAPAAHQSLEFMELEMIRQVVNDTNGNISEASKRLGISRNTIYRKLRWNDRH